MPSPRVTWRGRREQRSHRSYRPHPRDGETHRSSAARQPVACSSATSSTRWPGARSPPPRTSTRGSGPTPTPSAARGCGTPTPAATASTGRMTEPSPRHRRCHPLGHRAARTRPAPPPRTLPVLRLALPRHQQERPPPLVHHGHPQRTWEGQTALPIAALIAWTSRCGYRRPRQCRWPRAYAAPVPEAITGPNPGEPMVGAFSTFR